MSQRAADGTEGRRGGAGAESRRTDGRTTAEWTTLGVSTAIVLALVGFVLYQHFAGGKQPAVIEVNPRLDAVRREAGTYHLPVEITNRGDLAAEDVRVQIALTTDRDRRQSSELGTDFLAGGASFRGVVAFEDDPARGNLTIDGLSFVEP
jgi:uncharacterized protein (TIGR02588 family)